MTHTTFYRKYRSQTFSEIIGQPHIIHTLQNAITYDRLSHAYIFSGPRGTGKTSTARIFAKTLNCKSNSEKPCASCEPCQHITSGTCVDVIEIDAASNTGVDNIRALNEQVNFVPVECTYKFYIIDEAHMLSAGAFNALLKTLEEPPENTIFILATTEPHKIPLTIHSRCQHLHFKRMTVKEILEQLKMIAQKEAIEIQDKTLEIIARNADGGMRDAISLLDQMFAYKGNRISTEDALFILGAANRDQILKLLDAFFKKDVSALMREFDQLVIEGTHISQLLSELIEQFRKLLLIKMDLSNQIAEDEAMLTQLKTMAGNATFNELQAALETLSKTEMELRLFPNPELLVQVRVMALMNPQTTAPAKPMQQAAAPTQKEQPVVSQPKPKASVSVETPKPIASPPQISAHVTERPVITPQPQSQPQPKSPPASKSDLESAWELVLKALNEKARPLFAILRQATPVAVENNKLQVRLLQDFQFFREKLKEPESQRQIEEILASVFQKKLAFELVSAAETTQNSNSEQKKPEPPKPPKKINQLIEMFDGTVV